MSQNVSFLERLQDKIMNVTAKVQSNIYIQSITHGMMGTMGVLVGGSIINLFVNLPIPGWTDILSSIGIYDVLTMVVKLFQLTAPITAFNIGYALAKFKNVHQLQAGIISFMCFMLTIPVMDGDVISMSSLNAQNIACALITGLLATAIFSYITNKNIVIHMPESVPEFVSTSLSVIPAGLLTVLPFIILRGILATTSFGSFPGLINALVAMPLQNLGNNLSGHMAFLFLACLVWWFGIHSMPVLVVASIVMGPAATENVNAVMSGVDAPNLLSWTSFMVPYQLLGGQGCMIGLYLATVLFAKSDRYKVQGKIQLIPGLFNITEPTMFGMPIILNTTILIPYLLVPQVVLVAMYFCLELGLFTTPIVSLSNYLPGPITGWFMGGGLGLGLFMVIAAAFSTLCYIPFVKMMDKQALKEEAELEENK